MEFLGLPLVVQWLRLQAPNAGGTGLIPDQGIKIPHTTQCGPKKKKSAVYFYIKLLTTSWGFVLLLKLL